MMRDTTMDVPMDYTELIDNLIRDEVIERKNDINQVKNVIRNEIEKHRNSLQPVTDKTVEKHHDEPSLGTIENAYIQKKYIEYCLECWVQEVARSLEDNQIKLSSGDLNHDIVQDLLNSLQTIQSLRQIPEPLNQLPYYRLLMKNYDLISSNNEKTFMKKFKSICYEQIVIYTEFAQTELDFLKAFVNFLLASRNIQQIIDELQLRSFCCGDLPFDELVNGVKNLEVDDCETEVMILKKTAHSLKREKEPLLAKTFKEVINACIKPLKIEQKTLDGRLVIEVTGKCIFISEILPELETLISNNSDIEEVRIVGADILHVDMNLKNDIWHGKNVFILTKMMKIHDEITWDVSGEDYHDNQQHDAAGTGEDGHGKTGKDGGAGESGGNILIRADEVKNPENFTIISHGGQGGRGQDGGNGRDGDPGIGITNSEFKEKFPTVVVFLRQQSKRELLLKKTIDNITRSSPSTRPEWSKDGMYIKTMTSEGNEITFSYCSAALGKCLQSFLLYKGSFGKLGGRGGEWGLGGQGGYNGSITLNNTNICVHADRGNPGQDGNGGQYGYHGQNAWDMGYADYQNWPKAKFYGSDQRSKLQLTYHDTTWRSAPKDSVWCPYRQEYAQISYAGKVEETREMKYVERVNTRQNNAPQHQAMATKKKIILEGKMMSDYSHCYRSQEWSALLNSEVYLDDVMQRALQEMIENAEQQDEVTTQTKVRYVESAHRDRDVRHKGITAVTSSITSRDINVVDIESLINLLTSGGGLDGHLKELRMNEMDRSVLERLFLYFDKRKNKSSENIEQRDLQEILNEKYRFAVLREIAIQLPGDHYATNPMVVPESVSRYLIVDKENENNISHPDLGTLNQYLYQNGKKHREQVYAYFHENLRNSADFESLKSSVGIFVLKEGKSEQVHSNIKKYYLDHEEFSKKKDHSLKIYLEPLSDELKRYQHIFALWIERNNNQSARIDLAEEIRKNVFLNALYNRYNKQLKQEYDWTKCCRDEDFLKEYNDHLCEKGPFSESYRELLAHVFRVNIKVYFTDEDDQFYMLNNHNSSSHQTIHLLKQENEFKQLNMDEDYLRLETERIERGQIYAKILAEIRDINEKQELDDYLERKTFLTDDASENNSQWSYGDNSEQYEDISEYGTEALDDTDDEVLKRSVRAYILKVGRSEKVHPEVKKYYNEFQELSEKREQSFNIYFEPFYNKLRRQKHIFALWTASNNNNSAKSDFEKEMMKYNFLNTLYNRFDNQLKKFEYDWSECCENTTVLKAFEKYVRKNGPLPKDQLRHFTDQDSGLENSYTHIFTEIESVVEKQSDSALETQSTYCSDSDISDNEYLIHENQEIDEIIKYFQSPEERLQMKKRLEKVTSQYTGQRGIIHYLLRRFYNDGMHLSFQELCYLVNSILNSVVQDRKELMIICWIVAAYPQKSWLDELVLLQLENYFKKSFSDKSKWKKYLSKVKNKDILLSLTLKLNQSQLNNRIPVQCIEQAMNFLSEIPNEAISLEGLDLREWPDALQEQYWKHRLMKLTKWERNEDLSAASYYLLALEDTADYLLVEKFVTILESKDVLPGVLLTILNNLYTERWYLQPELLESLSICNIDIWVEKMESIYIADQKERDVTRLVELIKGHASVSIIEKLPTIENSLLSIRRRNPTTGGQSEGRIGRIYNWFRGISNTPEGTSNESSPIENSGDGGNIFPLFSLSIKNDIATSEETFNESLVDEDLQSIREEVCTTTEESASNMTERDLKIHFNMFRMCLNGLLTDDSEKKQFIEKARIGMLAVIDRAIEIKRGFKLRDTQKVAILALLTNERKTLAQVSTGEGKSLIVVAASIIKASCKEKVDIITSSSVLAERDAEGNKDIYSLFGISVSHNCSEDIEKRKEAYFSGQVVYGDLSNFQRDYLLDRFYDKNILGDRNFENVFVDEVDSMLLDKGNNMLYLSHDLPGLDKLESLYVYIWRWVNRPVASREDFSSIFDPSAIKESILHDLYGLILKADIKKLDSALDDQQASIIWERLIEAEILDDQGKMLTGNVDKMILERVLNPKFIAYENRLFYLLKESIERNKKIHVPNYLKPFIEQHLDTWIKSAIAAAVMQEGHDYVMEADKTGTSEDLNPHVTIVDRDTGTYQANSQWDEALHQFLQLKHGCKLSLQSLKAVFISNVSYLKIYKNLYGVTGTLGSRRERDLLLEIHDADFVIIPTAMPKRFFEEVPILCTEKNKWLDEIFKEVKEFVDKRKRSILIICETINDAETLERDFIRKGAYNIHTFTREYIKLDIAQGTKELEPGHIIIATNLCGRGTDIKITEELKNAGGLHVCLTYLPKNNRIEQQAFGRGARCGNKGSGRLIILDTKGKEYSNLKILELKKQRDAEELLRIPDIKAYYETQIITEERYFEEFKNQYKKLTKSLTDKNVDFEARQILLQSCLNKWAFWLDRNSKCMENLADEEGRNNLKNSLDEFILQLNNLTGTSMEPWVEGQPVQMIKFGKYLSQIKKYDDAIKLFDKVIDMEPCFSEAAHYYKAFALMKTINWRHKALFKVSLDQFKFELRKARRLLKDHSKFSILAASVIDSMKEQSQARIIQIDTYQKQQESMNNLYGMFSQSIDQVFGQPVTPVSFCNTEINAELSEIIYEDLLSNGILKKLHVETNISEEACDKISFGYGIPNGELKSHLSTFRGKEIDEKEFKRSLKVNIQLPSREDFWKLLLQENILSQEVQCIIIDVAELNEVDPLFSGSLHNKIDNKELDQETLEYDSPNEIILNTEQTDPQKRHIILEKSAFKRVLADDDQKYEYLKKKRVFTCNKKAHIDLSKISSSLPRYDSITLEDFSKANIAENDAEKILAGLVEEKILKKVNSENDTYRLVIPYNQIKLIQFPAYPVYRNAVIELLSLYFMYRIALERIAEQLKKRNIPTDKILPSKPHHSLIYELIDQNIISPAKYITEIKNLKQRLTNIYSRILSADDLKALLTESRLIPEERYSDDLRNCLVAQKWLRFYGEPNVPKTHPTYSLQAVIYSTFGSQYGITDSEIRQNLPPPYEDLQETIRKIFDNRFKLSNGATLDHIIRVLERSRSPLNTSTFCDSDLEPITKYSSLNGSKHVEEVNILTLNGFDQILRVVQKKWSSKMLINTATVALFGVIQIVAGIVIEIFLLPATQIGISFIGEGISDIIFGIQVLCSGRFSWMDYMRHKIRSLMLTVATGGLTFLYTRGVDVSRFGFKVSRSTLNIGENVAETTSSRLLETTAIRSGVIISRNQIISQSLDASAAYLANGGVDVINENHLRMLCDGIKSALLSCVKKVFEECNISINLEKIYQISGKDEALKFVSQLSDIIFNKQSLTQKYLPIALKIARSATKEIKNAIDQISRSGNTRCTSFDEIINAVIALIPKAEDLVDVGHVQNITSSLLNNLVEKLTIGDENNSGRNSRASDKKEIKSRERFKKETIERWYSLLDEEIGQIMDQHVARPILEEGAGCWMGYCKNLIKKRLQFCRVAGNNERSKELGREYLESQRSSNGSGLDHVTEIEDFALNQYHNNLNMLTAKMRNPKLLAALIRENVPLDVTCLNACTIIITKLSGIQGLTIIAKGRNGMKKRFSFSVNEAAEIHVIQLELINDRFLLHGSRVPESNRNGERKNNYLYEALSGHINLNMTREDFRAAVANCIEYDPDVQCRIEQGLNSFSTSSASGGESENSESIDKLRANPLDEKVQHSQRSTKNSKTCIPTQKRPLVKKRSRSVERTFSTKRLPARRFSTCN